MVIRFKIADNGEMIIDHVHFNTIDRFEITLGIFFSDIGNGPLDLREFLNRYVIGDGDATMADIIRKFDYVVLITGDADHEMLIKKLKTLKIHAILLTWDVANDKATSTAKLLRDEACTHIELNKLVAADTNLRIRLCKSK